MERLHFGYGALTEVENTVHLVLEELGVLGEIAEVVDSQPLLGTEVGQMGFMMGVTLQNLVLKDFELKLMIQRQQHCNSPDVVYPC